MGHVSQIYTGLYDLQAENKIKISFSFNSSYIPQDLLSLKNSHRLLWTEVKNIVTRQSLKVCFDLRDTGNILIETLQKSDIYFKRSYSHEWINKQNIKQGQQQKIFPYGLNYACRSEHQFSNNINRITTFNHLLNYQFINKQFSSNLKYNFKQVSFNNYKFSTQFEVGSEVPAEKFILFQTRVYDPKKWNDEAIKYLNIKELNLMRVEIIRALKDKFGSKFIGGLQKTDFSENKYPDCITPFKTGKSEYLKLIKKCLITITNSGLVQSNGFKLPEYIAASRCIITEPLKYELPTPLKEQVNIITFNNPEECIKACENILQDPNLAKTMRKNNENYYNNELKPSILISKCLDRAFRGDLKLG